MKCCTVTADTHQNPTIKVEFKALTLAEAKLVAHILTGGFRSVECVNDLTGEVMKQYYVSDEFFAPIYTVSEALKNVEALLNGQKN